MIYLQFSGESCKSEWKDKHVFCAHVLTDVSNLPYLWQTNLKLQFPMYEESL